MRSIPTRNEYTALFLLSVSTLVFEINLTRIFSVTQFYHFAFMIVSLALLGSGASGTFLVLSPSIRRTNPRNILGLLSTGCAASILGSYLVVNWFTFDSFTVALDRKQIVILLLHYIILALPFFFVGLSASLMLQAYPLHLGAIYAANLGGSAVGCLLSLSLPALVGGEGMVVSSCGLAAMAALACPAGKISNLTRRKFKRFCDLIPTLTSTALLIFSLFAIGMQGILRKPLPLLAMQLSQYKAISYALQVPGAQIMNTLWNSFSRVDRVASQGIRSFPGLSYQYMQELPTEDAIFIDGDDLSPIIHSDANLDFTAYMPASVAYLLLPGAQVLILEPRGGLDIHIAQAAGAAGVTAVEMNPLSVELAGEAYQLPKVRAVIDTPRSYLQRTENQFDVIVLSLTSGYHPIRSGAYSLVEDYHHTVEAYSECLQRLEKHGVFVITHWLQTPASEELRSFSTAIAAIELSGGNPPEQIVAFRGYNTLTLLLKRSPFNDLEMEIIRTFIASRAYDLVAAPDINPQETNQFNILPEEIYFQSFQALLQGQSRENFLRSYPYEIRPPTDDRPFFGHFFKWSQSRQVLVELGKTWQPFGGAGYLVIVILLLVAVIAAALLILLPVLLTYSSLRNVSYQGERNRIHAAMPVYFALIGFAYLLIEIPLIQRFILYLGHPAYAMTTILFTVLLFSGLGSFFSNRIPLKPTLAVLSFLILLLPEALPALFSKSLSVSLVLRLLLTIIVLAPVGFLMGVPFPAGLRWFLGEGEHNPRLSWIWSVNGAASVVAAVLAALLAISFGLTWVLRIGAMCYAGAWIMATVFPHSAFAGSRRR